jgi:hypothetical protein
VLNDFLHDTVDSFWRGKPIPSVKLSKDIQIFLESADDDSHFTELVQEQLAKLNPQMGAQIQIVPSLKNVSESERTRYLGAKDLAWDMQQLHYFLDKIHQAGQKSTSFDFVNGFKHVKFVELNPGEKLIEAGAPSSFVYFPLGDGLRIIPLGGYQSFSVAAWCPLGTTGVIRGDIRNADIVAEERVALLMLPKEVYLRYWYAPYTPAELKSTLTNETV